MVTGASNQRKYNILVFGASGFTGKYVLAELIKSIPSDGKPPTIAIAGRTKAKLEDLLVNLSKESEGFSGKVDCFEVDFSSIEDITNVTGLSSVVISCVGPYQLFGEPIVEACVLSGTHYVDITGEPRFVERMFCKYNEAARSKDIMIVHYCGFDSVPADLGSLLVRQKLNSLGKAALSMEMFISFEPTLAANAINFTTFQSALVAIGAGRPDLSEFKSKLPPCTTYGKGVFCPLVPRENIHTGKYYTLFPVADPLVVNMSQSIASKYPEDKELYFGNRYTSLIPAKPYSFYSFNDGQAAIVTFISWTFILLLCQFKAGLYFLHKYPHWATFGHIQPPSAGGPSQAKIDGSSFKIEFLAKGVANEKLTEYSTDPSSAEPDCEIKAIFEGPNAGYNFTSKSVVIAALTILKEKVIHLYQSYTA
ncbi:hypothetical protein DSO57_1023956 [Entomophthora muscae]|uniref:Uncharacterized protein n=1 Tax=Entomophthora muscae TaxID=34485 RepID=A0ACC2UNI5_9FUNG|nr:hypothetical protein DSO57_1023956 [Entomophthora muscae]